MSRSPFDYYLRGVTLNPPGCRYNLAPMMLEYNHTDFPQAVAYATQALERTHALNKNPQYRQTSLIRVSVYERQGRYR